MSTQQQTDKSTPRPWGLSRQYREIEVIGPDGQVIAGAAWFDSGDDGTWDGDQADMALIALAVNAHAALVEALEALLHQYRQKRPQIFGTDAYEDQARAALALARGEK